MKTVLLLLLFSCAGFAQDVSVNAYLRSDGTFVSPHYRTAPNETMYDNYSTIGNINPYTGKRGTINPTGVSTASYMVNIPTHYSPPISPPDYSYLKPYSPPILPEYKSNSEFSTSTTSNLPKLKVVRGGKYFQKVGSKKNYIKQTIRL